MTDVSERLSEIRERVEAATGGPWTYSDVLVSPFTDEDPYMPVKDSDGFTVAKFQRRVEQAGERNARFIASARSDVPYLLSLVEGLGKALRRAVSGANYVHPCEPPRPTNQWICDACRQVGNGPSLIQHKEHCPVRVDAALRDAAQEGAE